MIRKSTLALVIVSVYLISGSRPTRYEQEEWIQLFNGKNLDDWIPEFAGYQSEFNCKNTF